MGMAFDVRNIDLSDIARSRRRAFASVAVDSSTTRSTH